MSLTTGALQIGRSALLSYQSALQVVGQNITNAGVDGYTRQTAVLSPIGGVQLPEGFTPGAGVALSALRRNIDETLENRLRIAMGNEAGTLVQQQMLGRIEGVMNELSDADLSTLLQAFFNAFSNVQNQPHEAGVRGMAIAYGNEVAAEIRRQRGEILALADEINQDIATTVGRADDICREIGDLNVRIAAVESTGRGGAAALRDQRDRLLRELAELIQVEVREQPNGGIYVYAGNEPLIQDGLVRGLTTTQETQGGYTRTVVRFKDNNSGVELRGGRIAGQVRARDELIFGQIERLNGLARALIQEVNKVHASGQGLTGFTSLTGTFDVLDPAAALNSAAAGLDLTPRNGSFLLTVRDSDTGLSRTSTITVDLDGIGADETLASLAAQINAKAANVNARVTADNRLQLTATSGFEFTFAQDSSNVLAALGLNTFFDGRDAQSLTVNAVLTADVNRLAAATNGAPGDGSNAAALAALATTALAGLGGRSINDYYNAIVSDVAVRGAAARASTEAAGAIKLSLQSQRESISGVSLDEETINLLRMERAFQGAARYVSTVDRLLDEVLTLVG